VSQKVSINVHHLTRVEGHGNIVVDVNNGKIEKMQWQVPEAPRFFEAMIRGRHYSEVARITSRICGICSHAHSTAYAIGVEKLAGVPAPPRAQAIRELVAELERIHSHMLWLGVAAHEGGFDTLFMYSWRDREVIMDILDTEWNAGEGKA